jgi:hypothetical protein
MTENELVIRPEAEQHEYTSTYRTPELASIIVEGAWCHVCPNA